MTENTTTPNNNPTAPTTTSDKDTIVSYTEYQQMINQVEAMAKELQALKSSKDNTEVHDIGKGIVDKDKKEKQEEEEKNRLVTEYADVKANFDKYVDKNLRDQIEDRLKGCSKLTDKINVYAKMLIRKAYKDTDSINALIEGFKTDATQEDSAFRQKYKDSLQMLEANKSSVTDSLFDKRVSDFSVEELKNLRKDLIDHRTKNEARKKAINWGLISA